MVSPAQIKNRRHFLGFDLGRFSYKSLGGCICFIILFGYTIVVNRIDINHTEYIPGQICTILNGASTSTHSFGGNLLYKPFLCKEHIRVISYITYMHCL